MYNRNFQKRHSLKYKIKMWFYRATKEDYKIISNKILNFVIEFLIGLVGFLFLFIFPALFH